MMMNYQKVQQVTWVFLDLLVALLIYCWIFQNSFLDNPSPNDQIFRTHGMAQSEDSPSPNVLALRNEGTARAWGSLPPNAPARCSCHRLSACIRSPSVLRVHTVGTCRKSVLPSDAAHWL